MRAIDFEKLNNELEAELLRRNCSVGILGLTSVTFQVLQRLSSSGRLSAVEAIYTARVEPEPSSTVLSVPVVPISGLARANHDILVVASDEEKEDLLIAAKPYVRGTPKVILGGYQHFAFRDEIYRKELAQLLVPSLANGYPNTLPHLYQCLQNAARLGLQGVVAEFGMFKGGTTMFLSRIIERLSMKCRVIGFDTFGGFPPRRSFLDMYDHPDCVFTDLDSVTRYLSGRNVEIVVGDIVETCHRLDHEDVVLTFLDTDNYTSAAAAIDVVRERTLVGGAIVFDHLTGVDRFCYTLGERIAGTALLSDARYFNLHGTGVFCRQR